ncbi:MAG: hypothetical protein U1B94_03770 [candidate division NC10 bacterium]|nr:hypothetical protein [candidate division NC10 bacterium]
MRQNGEEEEEGSRQEEIVAPGVVVVERVAGNDLRGKGVRQDGEEKGSKEEKQEAKVGGG